MDINVFTASMRSEFLKAFYAADPAVIPEWQRITQVIPSTARIENYAFMSPAPGIQEYQGHRRLATPDSIKYQVSNKEYDGSFTVLNRDVEDDQVGGYQFLPAGLAAKAKMFPGRLTLQKLSQGESTVCFDGSNFFADSHNIGTGDNKIAHTSTGSSDAATFNVALLYTGNVLKPLIYQDRKAPNLQTDAGTPQSLFAKKTNYWADLEGAAAYGYWWDACWCNVTNTPSVADCIEIFRKLTNAMRTFKLPKAAAGDPDEYVHEQTRFTAENCVLVVGTALENLFDQVLNETWVPQSVGSSVVATTNVMKGKASLIVSAYMNE